MVNPIRYLALALAFLTVIPLPVRGVRPEDIRGSSAFFPLTGWLIGGLMAAGALAMAGIGLDPLPAGALLVAFQAWFTKGLHLDGVADVCDGLGGGYDPERRLAIMKDSATGAFGVIGLILTLIAKTAALSVLLAKGLYVFIAFVPAASRWAIVVLSWISRYPRERGTGHPFVGQVRGREVLLGLVWLLPAFLLSDRPDYGLPGVSAVLLCSLLPALYLRVRGYLLLGGVTGDLLGASCEFGEALGFATASVILV